MAYVKCPVCGVFCQKIGRMRAWCSVCRMTVGSFPYDWECRDWREVHRPKTEREVHTCDSWQAVLDITRCQVCDRWLNIEFVDTVENTWDVNG